MERERRRKRKGGEREKERETWNYDYMKKVRVAPSHHIASSSRDYLTSFVLVFYDTRCFGFSS